MDFEFLPNNIIRLGTNRNRPRKITGTRFPGILGFNKYATPFQTWCELTRLYEKPFTETRYTRAGKTIEPKQLQYIRDLCKADRLVTPVERFGEGYFRTTWGDFFPDNASFGGMWDGLLYAGNTLKAVVECKTSSKPSDWCGPDGKLDFPPYQYVLQACFYAALLGTDQVIMAASILQPADYDAPEEYVCNKRNTFFVPFRVSAWFSDFSHYMKWALDWYNEFVVTGVSPVYDDVQDAEYLRAIRAMKA